MKINIKPTKNTQAVLKMADELPARITALRKQAVRQAGIDAYVELVGRIPSGKEYAPLWKSIELMQVSGTDSSYLLRAKPRGKMIQEQEVPRTLLYVQAKRGPIEIPREITILEEHSPWTADTIPFTPKSLYAVVVQRKVRKKAVLETRKMRIREKPVWRRKLAEAGIRVRRNPKYDLKKARVIPDVMAMSINLEFGLGNMNKPHWRPTLITLRRGITIKRELEKQSRHITSPRFMRWKTWPLPVDGAVGIGAVKKCQGFQDKLGLM